MLLYPSVDISCDASVQRPVATFDYVEIPIAHKTKGKGISPLPTQLCPCWGLLDVNRERLDFWTSWYHDGKKTIFVRRLRVGKIKVVIIIDVRLLE